MKTLAREERILDATDAGLQLRTNEGKPTVLRGYAAVYSKRSVNMGTAAQQFYETIAPGAFDHALNDDVRALFNHNPDKVLARSRDGKGTLKLGTDARGLWYEFEIPQTEAGRDLVTSITRGDVNQSSFAFTLSADGQQWKDSTSDGVRTTERTITKIGQLHDVSPVTYPAYEDTTAQLVERALAQRPAPPPAPVPLFSEDPREAGLRIFTK